MKLRAAYRENARIEAFKLRHRCGVERPDHLQVERVAARLGIRLLYLPLNGATAQLLVRPGRVSIVVSDRITDPAERRFAIAHELGHYVLRHPAPPAAELCEPRPRDPFAHGYAGPDDVARDIEEEADIFAMELLMPGEIVRNFCDRRPMTLDVPAQIAQICGVSLVASAVRVTERTYRVCAAVLRQHGRVRWTSPSTRFLHRFGMVLPAGYEVDRRSVASQFFDRGRLPEEPLRVPISTWVDAPEELHFEEHATSTGTSGEVISMLWLADDVPRSAIAHFSSLAAASDGRRSLQLCRETSTARSPLGGA